MPCGRWSRLITVGRATSPLASPYHCWPQRLVAGRAILLWAAPCCRWLRHLVAGKSSHTVVSPPGQSTHAEVLSHSLVCPLARPSRHMTVRSHGGPPPLTVALPQSLAHRDCHGRLTSPLCIGLDGVTVSLAGSWCPPAFVGYSAGRQALALLAGLPGFAVREPLAVAWKGSAHLQPAPGIEPRPPTARPTCCQRGTSSFLI